MAVRPYMYEPIDAHLCDAIYITWVYLSTATVMSNTLSNAHIWCNNNN
jgi:hypothetical protein